MSPPSSRPIPFPSPNIVQAQTKEIEVENEPCKVFSIASAHTKNIYGIVRSIKETIYGEVYVAEIMIPHTNNENLFTRSGDYVAIKSTSKKMIKRKQHRTQENPLQEIGALQYIGNKHPNVMGQRECLEDSEWIYSVMDYVDGGEVFEFVDSNGAMEENKAREIFRQVLDGLEHLQSLNISHRDLSLENLLLTSDNRCLIIDFGMALHLPALKANSDVDCLNDEDTQCAPHHVYLTPPLGVCGKKHYIAPEVLECNQSGQGYPINALLVDIWAAGVILFTLLTGVPPVESATTLDKRFRMIRDERLRELLIAWNMAPSEDAMDLLQNILRPDPSERLTISQMRSHPWMNVQ